MNEDVSKTNYYPIVVAGISGIGKSLFGIYALLRAVRENNLTVIYNYNNEAWYIIAPPKEHMQLFNEGDPKRLLLDLRDKYFDSSIGLDLMNRESEARKRFKICGGGELKWIFLVQKTLWRRLQQERQHGYLMIL